MKPKLVSFKLCPFVQRVNIVLLKKQVDYDLEYIDLSDPPEWFLSVSPFNRVPLLQVDEGVLFESAAIVEYIDERYGPQLHPEDMFLRAQNRSWIEECSEYTWDVIHLINKKTQDEFETARDELSKKLAKLERHLAHGPYFNGAEFSLVDASFAPFIQRITFIEELGPEIINAGECPGLNEWRKSLLNDESVQGSYVPELQSMFYKRLASAEGYISQLV